MYATEGSQIAGEPERSLDSVDQLSLTLAAYRNVVFLNIKPGIKTI